MEEKDRDLRTKPEHWEVIISYFEEYPQLIKNRFNNSDGDSSKSKLIWSKLTDHLNSLGFGQKTTQKWQMAIGRWKSKIKSKREQNKTGGGPSHAPQLTSIEHRLISAMGWKSALGDNNIELGLGQMEQQNILASGVNPPEEISPRPVHENSPPPLINFGESSTAAATAATPTMMEKGKRKRKIPLTTEKSKKFVGMHQMHKENLGVLSSIDKSLSSINKNMEELINILKNKNS